MGKILNALFLAALVLSSQAEPAWQTDLKAAKEQAKKENKAVLVDFTGSEWCGACIQLKKAVLVKPEFEKFAEKNLVLVELDFPPFVKKKVPLSKQKENEALSKEYNVEGFPTVVVLDSNGKELGRLEGYEGDNVKAYIKRLEDILANKK
jgi:protein disulfide-isomerase